VNKLELVHKRCFGVKNFMKAIKDEFVCKVCSRGNVVINENVEKGSSLNNGNYIESMKTFSYPANMLICGAGVESASLMRVRGPWAKLSNLSGFFTHKNLSLKLKKKLHTVCV